MPPKTIYTTGAYLAPMKCEDGLYRWVVTDFEDDTFQDGEVFNPPEQALREEMLWVEEAEDDENPVETVEFDEWRETYQPESLENGGGHLRFFDFPEDGDRLWTVDIHHLWTLIEEGDRQIIRSGARLVNRQGFYITQKPWQNKNIIIFFDDEANNTVP